MRLSAVVCGLLRALPQIPPGGGRLPLHGGTGLPLRRPPASLTMHVSIAISPNLGYTEECDSERILKIGQYLTKLCVDYI